MVMEDDHPILHFFNCAPIGWQRDQFTPHYGVLDRIDDYFNHTFSTIIIGKYPRCIWT